MATTSYPRARAGRNLLTTIRALARDTRGSAAVDYSLLLAAVALGMLAAVVTSDAAVNLLASGVECSLQDTCTGMYPGSAHVWGTE